jgi:dynactin complex subunit
MLSVSEDWKSSDDKKDFVKEEWNSDNVSKRTAADRIRQGASQARMNFAKKLNEARTAQKAKREYERSPAGHAAKLSALKQQYQYESARMKLSKVKSQRRKAQLESLGMFSTNQKSSDMGMGIGSYGKPSYSGFDSMFGFGGGSMKTTRMKTPKKSGFDEMFGF